MSLYLPSSDFLDAFLPLPPTHQRKTCPDVPDLSAIRDFKAERDIANEWRNLINPSTTPRQAALCPGYNIALSQDRWDPHDEAKLKVDAALFRNHETPDDGRPHWASQRLLIEFKPGGIKHDPFDDATGDAEAQKRTVVRAQLTHYAAHVFAHQQRTAIFIALVNGTRMRVTRWDRAGTIFTEAFDYVDNPTLLRDFLWRFSMLSDEAQGVDYTTEVLLKNHEYYKLMDTIAKGPLKGQPPDICGDEGAVVPKPEENTPLGTFSYIRKRFAESLVEDWPRYCVTVPCESQKSRKYLIGKPTFLASGMVGRATRGYIAWDVKARKFVWLKDTWRAYYLGIDPEGDILRRLQEAGVTRIPTLALAGDLGQETQTHFYRDKAQNTNPEDVSAEGSGTSRGSKRSRSGTSKATIGEKKKISRVRHMSHYRLVVEEVCLPLSEVTTSRQLVQVASDCWEAHEEAVKKTRLIHGDISLGNVLILPTVVEKNGILVIEWRGVLADWELAKAIPKDGESPKARQPERTGTWQFMSAALLWYPRLPIGIPDEVESLFYVIIYSGVRYLRSTVSDVSSFLLYFFDSYSLQKNNYRCGHKKLDSMVAGNINVGTTSLEFYCDADETSDGHPLNTLLVQMLPVFKARYTVIEHGRKVGVWYHTKTRKPENPPRPPPAPVKEAAAQLDKHAYFKAVLRRMLDDAWPVADYVGDRTAPTAAKETNDNKENEDPEDDDQDLPPNKRNKADIPEMETYKHLGMFLCDPGSDDSDDDSSHGGAVDAPMSPLAHKGSASGSGARSGGRGGSMRGGLPHRSRAETH